MRLSSLFPLVAVPALLAACSSGGEGSTGLGSIPGGFGTPGPALPAFNPLEPVEGGDTVNPQQDSGPNHNTDSQPLDTNTGVDTSMCARKCSADEVNPLKSTCEGLLAATQCTTEARALANCYDQRRVCSLDGTTDQSGTVFACSEEQSAYSSCFGS
jgi:hypothetical protein